jgi:IS30 family transposase
LPLDGFSQADLNKVVARLNGRPRQTLQFMNPAEKLAEAFWVLRASDESAAPHRGQ